MNRHFTEEDVQLAKKPMKRCSTVLAIREMPTIPQRETTAHPSEWQGPEENGPHTWMAGKYMVQPVWKTVWQFLKKADTCLQYDAAAAFFDIHPREMKVQVHIKSCT